jgi:hypothetical protein
MAQKWFDFSCESKDSSWRPAGSAGMEIAECGLEKTQNSKLEIKNSKLNWGCP